MQQQNLLQRINSELIEQLGKPVDFRPGDTVLVTIPRTREIKSTRKGKQPEIKTYTERTKGICLGKCNKSTGSSFLVKSTVGSTSYITRFPLYGTAVELIDQGVVRRAKLYYLKNLQGKKARVEFLRDYRSRKKIQIQPKAQSNVK